MKGGNGCFSYISRMNNISPHLITSKLAETVCKKLSYGLYEIRTCLPYKDPSSGVSVLCPQTVWDWNKAPYVNNQMSFLI